jgi:hypothetical protein
MRKPAAQARTARTQRTPRLFLDLLCHFIGQQFSATLFLAAGDDGKSDEEKRRKFDGGFHGIFEN